MIDRALTWVARGLLGLRSKAARTPSRGERTLASLFPGGRYGWPGGWSQDRLEQVTHFRHWVYVAVRARCEKFAQLVPQIATVAQPGSKTARRFVKALSPVQSHEELEPVGPDHPLSRLLHKPNQVDTSFDLWYETSLFEDLTGNAYWWVIPNRAGTLPAEIWVIPSHWVWPRTGSDRLIEYFEVRPWGGLGSAGLIRLPPEEVIHFKGKSALNKIDGYSALSAGAQWIDVEESISASRWAQFKNSCRPELSLELGPEYQDPTDDQIARIEAKFFARYQGEYNTGRPIITPPGAKLDVLGLPPPEMIFVNSEEQIRDMLLTLFQVPKVVVGQATEVNRASAHVLTAAFCTHAINPRLAYRGQVLTEYLAPRYPGNLRCWWDDCTPDDREQVNADLLVDGQLRAISPNEVRAIRGREPWPAGVEGADEPVESGAAKPGATPPQQPGTTPGSSGGGEGGGKASFHRNGFHHTNGVGV